MKFQYFGETRNLIGLSLPVILAQLAQTGIIFVDAIMAGHYNQSSLSGVGMAMSIWLPTILFGQGLLSVLTPIISNLNGANKRDKIANNTKQGLIISAILAVIIMVFLYHCDSLILFISDLSAKEIDADMLYVAVHFLRSIIWGVPAFLFYLVYRFQCEGVSNTKPSMIIMFVALIFSIPVNYIFIYGKFGIPEFGGVGCGITAAITFWLMFILMKSYTLYSPSQKDIRNKPNIPFFDFIIIKRILSLGFPLAIAYFFEISLFTIITMLIAPLGQEAVSAHHIAFSISGMTFSIPLALGVATSIRVGYLLGKQDLKQAKQAAFISLKLALFSALIIATMLLVFKAYCISWFTNDQSIIDIALNLIILLALYQLSDYLQVTASNVLRGYKDTKSILYITLISYWIIGLPLGYILGLTDILVEPMGPSGFWIGIIAGLSFAAILLIGRMIQIQHQPIEIILKRASK